MNSARLKAELIRKGKILVGRDIRLPVLLSRSTAGPGAGMYCLFFRIGKKLVRLEVVRDGKAPLELKERHGKYSIYSQSRLLCGNVGLVPSGMHAPGQAFINLNNSCRFGCAFCTLDASEGPRGPTVKRWAELVVRAVLECRADSVAVTTGIPTTPARACAEMARFVRTVRKRLPRTPIGVEPYTTDARDLRILRKAGAGELKLNIQCATDRIFKQVCPALDWKKIWSALGEGVNLFGRGRVCSNLILGLGEKDADVAKVMEKLARMGVAVNLRPLRVNARNAGPLTNALGRPISPPAPERLVRLARLQKNIFKKYGLEPEGFRTMCHRCTACDIEPCGGSD